MQNADAQAWDLGAAGRFDAHEQPQNNKSGTEIKALDGEVLPPPTPWLTPSREEREALCLRITEAHQELAAGLRTTVEKAADLGLLLAEFKARFRGEWLLRLEQNTPIKRRMAAIYMQLARARDESERRRWKRISNLGINGALKELRTNQGQARVPRQSNAPILPQAASPVLRAAGPDADLVSQICSLLHRLREVSEKIRGADLYAMIQGKFVNDLQLSLPPAAGLIGDLFQAHARARVIKAKALAAEHGIEIDQDTAARFDEILAEARP